MKRWLRAFALVITLVLLFTACQPVAGPEIVTATTSDPNMTAAMTDPSITATPQPTEEADVPTPKELTAEQFRALDKEIFVNYVTRDGYTFHQMLRDPSAYGLSSADVTMTWGEFTEEDTEAYGLECAVYLERLLAIPRAELNERDQFSYDTLQQYLEDAAAENVFAYYYEPLTAFTGLHTDIPLALGLYKFEDEQDVIDYLLLLEDVPRYLGQVLAYEQKRAELGLFMTEFALDTILTACMEIIGARDSFYLIATFNDGVDSIEGLSAEAVEGYKSRNELAVTGAFIDAYQTLHDGLKAMRSSCRSAEGLWTLGETAMDFYEYSMRMAGNNLMSVEETSDMLRNELFYMLIMSVERIYENPDAYKPTDLTSGNAETDLAELEALANRVLFALPEHTITMSAVPEELEGQLSGAAYVIPPMDNWKDNEVLINPAKADNELLMTLAHEAYPGHMFQYVYQRSLTDTGLMQRVLHYGAYAEGWAQMAEYIFAISQTSYDPVYTELRFYEEMIAYVILPAIVSIYVNYYAYNEDAIRMFLTGLDIGVEVNTSYYYRLAVEQPFYPFSYATGYCQLAALMRDAEENMGGAYSLGQFLKAYLDLGPSYFNLVKEQMDVWIDAHMPTEA